MSSELSVEAGELTASLKIKRSVVAQNYRPIIDALYANTYEGGQPAKRASTQDNVREMQREAAPV